MIENKLQRKVSLAAGGLLILYEGLDVVKFEQQRIVIFNCICALGKCYFWLKDGEDDDLNGSLDRILAWLQGLIGEENSDERPNKQTS